MPADAPTHHPLYELDRDGITTEMLRPVTLAGGSGSAALVAPDGGHIPLSDATFEVLAHVLDQLQHGKAVQLVVYDTELTTQQAADILNISRQYLIRLLDRDEIPYSRVGTHRRLRLDDEQIHADWRMDQANLNHDDDDD